MPYPQTLFFWSPKYLELTGALLVLEVEVQPVLVVEQRNLFQLLAVVNLDLKDPGEGRILLTPVGITLLDMLNLIPIPIGILKENKGMLDDFL